MVNRLKIHFLETTVMKMRKALLVAAPIFLALISDVVMATCTAPGQQKKCTDNSIPPAQKPGCCFPSTPDLKLDRDLAESTSGSVTGGSVFALDARGTTLKAEDRIQNSSVNLSAASPDSLSPCANSEDGG